MNLVVDALTNEIDIELRKATELASLEIGRGKWKPFPHVGMEWGPMASDKTTRLMSSIRFYAMQGLKCLVIRFDNDKRYSDRHDIIINHSGSKLTGDEHENITIKMYTRNCLQVLLDEHQHRGRTLKDNWNSSNIVIINDGEESGNLASSAPSISGLVIGSPLRSSDSEETFLNNPDRQIYQDILNVDIVAIEEAQFAIGDENVLLDVSHVVVDKLNKIMKITSLDNWANGQPVMSAMLLAAKAEFINSTGKVSICKICLCHSACRSVTKMDWFHHFPEGEPPKVMPGGADLYMVICRSCYNKRKTPKILYI